MANRQNRSLWRYRLAWAGWLVGCAGSALGADAEADAFFESKVRPVLSQHCWSCHGAKKSEAGLRLDAGDFVRKGSDSGPVMNVKAPEQGTLIQAVRYTGDTKMPPDKKLPEDALAAIEHWVKLGAPWPTYDKTSHSADPLSGDWKAHWAFRPLKEPAIPTYGAKEGAPAGWSKSPIDAFVGTQLRSAKLSPSPRSDGPTILRRLSLDLIGLPPTLAQMDAFIQDRSPDALEKAVNGLLASPQYGEKWARHWLDISRYGDTKGYVFTEDRRYHQSHEYRDWVVRSLNNDMPYAEFVTRQLAADLLPNADPSSLVAMGFLTLGRRFLQNTHDIIDDRIDVVGRGLMGVTVSCARCHDHKFDPIPMKDYYALYGVFANSEESKDAKTSLALRDRPNPHDFPVFMRGNPGNRGPIAPRQMLMVGAGEGRKPFTKGSGRYELAQAIVDPKNPLTARVFVNRVWRVLFGKGLVNTPSDFGLRADPPSHPELLDYLASQFQAKGSIKSLVRQIVLSETYLQATARRDDGARVDPENRLLWRQNRRRLDWEATRDSMLFVAGRLDLAIGGPPVELLQSPYPTRRTLYGMIDRQNMPGVFRSFDFPNPDNHVPGRYTTTVPQQALFLMNHPFLHEQAVALVNQTNDPSGKPLPDEQATKVLYEKILGRRPDAREGELARAYLEQAPGSRPQRERLAQALLLTNEFVFVD